MRLVIPFCHSLIHAVFGGGTIGWRKNRFAIFTL